MRNSDPPHRQTSRSAHRKAHDQQNVTEVRTGRATGQRGRRRHGRYPAGQEDSLEARELRAHSTTQSQCVPPRWDL